MSAHSQGKLGSPPGELCDRTQPEASVRKASKHRLHSSSQYHRLYCTVSVLGLSSSIAAARLWLRSSVVAYRYGTVGGDDEGRSAAYQPTPSAARQTANSLRDCRRQCCPLVPADLLRSTLGSLASCRCRLTQVPQQPSTPPLRHQATPPIQQPHLLQRVQPLHLLQCHPYSDHHSPAVPVLLHHLRRA